MRSVRPRAGRGHEFRCAAVLDRCIDWDALLDTAIANIEVSRNLRQEFIASCKRSLTEQEGLVSVAKAGGSCRLLRVHDDDQQRRALVRYVPGNRRGISYFDFILSQQPDGRVRAIDIYVYLSGELLSQTMHRSFLQAAARLDPSLLDRLTGTENEFVRNVDNILALTTQFRQGRFREAMQVYEQLPPGLQHDENVLLMRLRMAQSLSDEQYQAVLEAMRTTFPRNANVDLLSIDYFLLKKDYARARKCIDRLDAATGGDPYLDLFRANAYMAEDKFEQARQATERLIKQEPEMVFAYWLALAISVKQQRYTDTARLLTILRQRFNIEMKDLSTIPEYAGFVKSPEYIRWRAEQEKQPSPASAQQKEKEK
jgi:tetratricopeptide (TPR) repeat protein